MKGKKLNYIKCSIKITKGRKGMKDKNRNKVIGCQSGSKNNAIIYCLQATNFKCKDA